MMLIGRSSRRENLLWVTGVEPMPLIRTRLANHIRASSREQWLHQQARHMTAPTAIVPMPNIVLDRKAPSTHDPTRTPLIGGEHMCGSVRWALGPTPSAAAAPTR